MLLFPIYPPNSWIKGNTYAFCKNSHRPSCVEKMVVGQFFVVFFYYFFPPLFRYRRLGKVCKTSWRIFKSHYCLCANRITRCKQLPFTAVSPQYDRLPYTAVKGSCLHFVILFAERLQAPCKCFFKCLYMYYITDFEVGFM